MDKAETQAETARLVNATTPGVLARQAASLGSLLVHFGTDYVFDGSGNGPRDELAPTGPLNVYGRTKLEGEQEIQASGCNHLILRTSWVYAARGGNFAKTMLRLAAERDSLRVIDDQVGAPTGADLLADVTAHTILSVRREPGRQGLYHVAAAGETSWHQYARFVIDWATARGCPLRTASDNILPIATADYSTAAARPLNSRLDTRRVQSVFGLTMPAWERGVERMLTEHLLSETTSH